jgi:MoaA/NifB/PqqE/SkfB family radical SAM enzyme
LNIEEIERIARGYGPMTKLSLSGGEPFIRDDVAEIIRVFDTWCAPAIVDIPTNGTYVDRIEQQASQILAYTERNQPVIEVQLSIDGPREIHDRIRGVPGLFDKVLASYWVLDKIRADNPRLRIKMNLTYVLENENVVIRLADAFDREYRFDRFQITFPHGARARADIIPKMSYRKYLEQSTEILKHSRSVARHDLHSLVFQAVKIIKDSVLLDVMETQQMGKRCHAGRRILVIDDQGMVYPCEPLWEPIGSLRETEYQVRPILQGPRYKAFRRARLGKGKCNCTWGNVMLSSIVFCPRYFPRILYHMVGLLLAGGKGIAASRSPMVQEILRQGDDNDVTVPGRDEALGAIQENRRLQDAR